MAIYYVSEKGDRNDIYNAAEKWKNECLLNDRSLIWDGEEIWTDANLRLLRAAFIENPDMTGASFDEKLKGQLENGREGLYKLVIEFLFIYYLFPVEGSVKYATKLKKLAMVASWKDIQLDQSLPIFKALDGGLGTTGTFFNTQKYFEISFLILVVEKLKETPLHEREQILSKASSLKETTEWARKEIGKRVQSQHILLHLLLPSHFERISSGGNKTKIIKSYADMLKDSETDDADKQLYMIREKLEEKYPNKTIDFYTTPEAAEPWRGGVWPKKQPPKPKGTRKDNGENPPINFGITASLDGLIFENEEVLVDQITTALANEKSIIFTGPPGTGKSKLANKVCDLYEVERTMVTASSNWSTFDTIGGYRPNREGNLYFSEGIFLNCFKDKTTGNKTNKWLIIDEINRADIDKAFGSLFSVLTGDEVELPFEAENGKIVTLIPEKHEETKTKENEYIVPNDWRMIATMNTIDKASLYEMSYAFMRRFAFIPVGIPKHISEELIQEYLSIWNMEEYPYVEQLTAIWKLINQYRKIGPAIIEDIAKHTLENEDFTSAIILYVLPQFEGLPVQRIETFIQRFQDVTDIVIDYETLEDFVEDFFDIGMLE